MSDRSATRAVGRSRRRLVMFFGGLGAAGVAFGVIVFGAAGGPARAQIACNDLVTASITLAADLNCPGTNGLRAGADGITINLGGHTISGDTTGGTIGVSVSGHSRVKVTNGIITGFEFGTYFSGAPTGSMTGLVVRANSYGSDIYASPGVKISGNLFAPTGTGMFIQSDETTVSGNTVVGGTQNGIFIYFASGVTVTKNTVTAGGTGITDWGVDSVISSNTVSANTNSGVVSINSGSEITKNTFQGNQQYGIYLSGANGITVSSNTVVGNQADGIYVDADSNTLSRNKLSANTGNGIFISSDSDGNLITTNTATGNTANGIDSENASASTGFQKNTATANLLKGIAAASGVTDLGGNKASNNGDPEQCSAGISCS
jgi:parallel beta-helix repeat protein